MKCHYEVLGISMQATPDEIKKAYRKLALEWHPDKNLHRPDEATEAFQLLQQAYEILIDPQEKAWYDRHRDEILRGGYGNDYKDNSLDIYQYYNTSCFKGYTDGEKGFYTVYREVFNKIAAEDEPFMDKGDVKMPQFGNSDSLYDDVVHTFYAYWQSYCTAKTYTWVDKYDLAEHRRANAGRQIIRLMEKENKKLRDQHKKIRNEEVRQLVAFVRKRDKRIQAHRKILIELNAEKAKKANEQRKKQMQERRQKDLQGYQESEWSSMSQLERHINEMEANLDNIFGADAANGIADNDNSDLEEMDLYCVACDKDFRSIKSMMNHEKSKKHKENAMFLKKVMQEEELNEQKKTPEEEEVTAFDINFDENGGLVEDISDNDELLENQKRSKKKKKKKKVPIQSDDDFEDVSKEDEVAQLETTDPAEFVVSSKENEVKQFETSVPTDCTFSSKENDGAQFGRSVPVEHVDSPLGVKVSEVLYNIQTDTKQSPDIKKSEKIKHAKATPKTEPTNGSLSEQAEQQSTTCEKCGNNYNSRNKLFEHLKKTGHALYLGGNATESAKDTTRKNKKPKKRK